MHSTLPRSISAPGQTVAEMKSFIEFVPQLVLVDELFPTFFCFSSCSVLVSYSSAYAIGVANIPAIIGADKSSKLSKYDFRFSVVCMWEAIRYK